MVAPCNSMPTIGLPGLLSSNSILPARIATSRMINSRSSFGLSSAHVGLMNDPVIAVASRTTCQLFIMTPVVKCSRTPSRGLTAFLLSNRFVSRFRLLRVAGPAHTRHASGVITARSLASPALRMTWSPPGTAPWWSTAAGYPRQVQGLPPLSWIPIGLPGKGWSARFSLPVYFLQARGQEKSRSSKRRFRVSAFLLATLPTPVYPPARFGTFHCRDGRGENAPECRGLWLAGLAGPRPFLTPVPCVAQAASAKS